MSSEVAVRHFCPSTLLMMWLYSLFLLAFVSPRAISGSGCLVETLKCSRLRPAFHVHKKLMVSSTQMDEMCKRQEQFFRCLDNVVGAKMEGRLPSGLEHARSLFREMCSGNSPWQKKYLELASCINKQPTQFCTTPEFLGKVQLGDRTRSKCSLREEALNCIAATLAINCGMDAGELFYHLLRMTSDGAKNCYSVGSEILFSPTLNAAGDAKLRAHNDAYGTLLRRIGNIPEQKESEEESLHSTVEDFTEDAYSTYDTADDTTAEELHTIKTPDSAMKVRNTILYSPPDNSLNLFHHTGMVQYIRFHSNTSYSEYFRYPDNPVEYIHCFKNNENGKIVCAFFIRIIKPICKEGGRHLQDELFAPFVPEELDPEFGAKLYAMIPDAYHFRKLDEKYVEALKRFLTGDLSDSSTESLSTDSEWASSTTYEYIRDLYKSQNGDNIKYPEDDATEPSSTPPGDLIQDYVMAVTTLMPPKVFGRRVGEMESHNPVTQTVVNLYDFGTKSTSMKQKKLLEENKDLQHIAEQFKRMSSNDLNWVTPFLIVEEFDPMENSRFLNWTFGRLNECHPNATNIFRHLLHFAPQVHESTEDSDSLDVRVSSGDSSIDQKLNDDAIPSPSKDFTRRLSYVRPVTAFYETPEQVFDVPVTEADVEYGSLDHPGELEESPQQHIPVLILEPNALSVLDSEQSYQTETSDESVDNGVETVDLISDEESMESNTPDENDIAGSLGQNLVFLASLDDLEDIIAGVENIQLE